MGEFNDWLNRYFGGWLGRKINKRPECDNQPHDDSVRVPAGRSEGCEGRFQGACEEHRASAPGLEGGAGAVMDEYMPQQPYSVWDQGARVHQVENARGLVPLMCILAAGSFVAMAVSLHALGEANRALDEAHRMQVETRVMQDDLKFIRAWTSARGQHIPANHEEAEEK